MACLARSTASFPETVQSERIPTRRSILVTLSQVSKSSSTTRALRPSSSSIFSSFLCAETSRSSSRITNSVPLPFSVITVIVPPIMSMMFLAMDIPRPVPCILLTVEVRSRSKGLNIFSANSWLMPIPVSLTLISYRPFPSVEDPS